MKRAFGDSFLFIALLNPRDLFRMVSDRLHFIRGDAALCLGGSAHGRSSLRAGRIQSIVETARLNFFLEAALQPATLN